jgi:uncharacterized membrane protein (UPF0127 family)
VAALYKLSHPASGRVLADQLQVADSFFTRLLGLMFRRRLEAGHGLWLTGTNGIHMFFMNFAIDAIFLDKKRRVVKAYRALPAWTGMAPLVWGADSVIELPSGSIDGLELRKGDQLAIERTP